MKIKTVLFSLLILLTAQTAFAGQCGCPGTKLMRGVEGLVTFPVEYLNQYEKISDKHGIIATGAGTILAGTMMSVKRIINGAYDIVTFPVPFPKGYGLLLPDKNGETALDAYQALQSKPLYPLS